MKFRGSGLFVVLLMVGLTCHVDPAMAGNFEDGVRHFRSGDYRKAVRSFQRAERAGDTRPALFFNLGVSYYRLGEHARARDYFLRVEKDPKFSQLAQYNLGRVALAQKRREEALQWFLRASRDSGDPRITALANRQIDAIEPGAGRQQARGGVRIAWGRDNNVLLLPDNSPSRRSDSYLETWLYGSARPGNRLRLNGSWYQRDYADVTGGDYQMLRVGADYLAAAGGWKLEPGLALSTSDLGTRNYLDITDLLFRAERSLGSDRLVVRYRYSDISAADAGFNYLAGSRHRARVDYHRETALGRVRYRYQLELNDRQDQATASYSPTRHDFRVRLRRRLTGPWRLDAEAQFRRSDYPSLAGIARQDDRLRLRLGFDYRAGRQWTVAGRIIWTDNSSNLAIEDYTRTDWQIAARLRF